MRFIPILFTLTSLLGHSNASAASACPTPQNFLKRAFDPLENYIQYRNTQGIEQVAKVIKHSDSNLISIETELGNRLTIESTQVTQASSKKSKAYFYSTSRSLERESQHLGNQALTEGFIDPTLKNSIAVEIEVETVQDGRRVKKWFSGYVVKPNPAGTKLEQHAYALEKNANKTVVLSDAANDYKNSAGFQDEQVKIRVVGSTKTSRMDMVVLKSDELKGKKFSTVVPHEGTHGYLDNQNTLGKGNSFSIILHDSSTLRPGQENFYHYDRYLEEHLTWIQDAVRNSRAMPESEIQKLFKANGSIPVSKVINISATERNLIDTERLFNTSAPRLKAAAESLKTQSQISVEELERLILKKDGSVKKTFAFQSSQTQSVEIPINTAEEWKLAQELANGTPLLKKQAKEKLFQIWTQKLDEQIQITEAVIKQLADTRNSLNQVRGKWKIAPADYQAFRSQMTKLADQVKLKNLKSASSP